MSKRNKKILKFILIMQIIIIGLIIYCLVNIVKWIVDNNLNNEINDEIADLITIETKEDVKYEEYEEKENLNDFEYEEKDIVKEFENENQTDKNDSNTNSNKDVSYKIDFKKLKELNNDVVGFIKVYGTNVEYVVVQGQDNKYYLTHNLKKEKNKAGWIFADYTNKVDGDDKNLVIYGHNRRNGTMFSSLKNILNKEWYNEEENRRIIFLNEEEQYIYEVFSIYQIKAEDYYAKTNFETEEDWIKFIDTISARTIREFDISVGKDDKILTLSTCSNNNSNRIVLHAVKIED